MRDFLKTGCGWLRTVWLWPLVLLALPNCTLDQSGLTPVYGFNPGSGDLSFAVMCEIPKVPDPSNPDNCADAAETGIGMSRALAAVSLAQGEFNSLGLDFSKAATTTCNGFPKKIDIFGQFPDGTPACLNCPQMVPAAYPDANAVCVAKCMELVSLNGPEPAGGTEAYCQANAHVATNVGSNECYAGGCTTNGAAVLNFPDPRREQVPIKWDELIGAEVQGDNTLNRTQPQDGLFSAGATSDRTSQRIKGGDAWIDFEPGQNFIGHVLGVSHDGGGNDVDASFSDIGFGISLDADNHVYILENGAVVAGAGGTLGMYSTGDRFRVYVKDNNDGSASISYYHVAPGCTAGTKCATTLISNQVTNPGPQYPLRVDASLGNVNGKLVNVTMVFIHQ